MSEKTHFHFSLFGKFMNIVRLAEQLEKKPRRFGTDELLSSPEVRIIEIIGEKAPLSVTDTAALLGVTKGAVSQVLKKLESRGLIDKTPDPHNISRTVISLTNKGNMAYYTHKHWHDTMDGGFKNYFESLDPDKIEFLHQVLDRFELFLEKRIDTEK